MSLEITDAEFTQEVEKGSGVVLVDFWAPWCGPCLKMAPIFEKTAQKYSNAKFYKINTSENVKKASKYGVISIPCIIIFKNGKEMERLIGFKNESALEKMIDKYLNKQNEKPK